MQNIVIRVDEVRLHAELNDSDTAQQIAAALPIEASARVWGDEIYFRIPVSASEASDARAAVAIGTLAYWPPGNAFCIFYGPTPVSINSEPRAASPVNIVGRVLGDVSQLRGTQSGAKVEVALVQS